MARRAITFLFLATWGALPQDGSSLSAAWKLAPAFDEATAGEEGLARKLLDPAILLDHDRWIAAPAAGLLRGTERRPGKWRRLASRFTKESAAGTGTRDLYAVEAAVRAGAAPGEEAGVLEARARTTGLGVAHAWHFVEHAGAGADPALPIYALHEMVEVEAGHGPDGRLEPRARTRCARVQVLYRDRAELHLLGDLRFLLPSPESPAEGAAPASHRVRVRKVHLVIRYEKGRLTLETSPGGDAAAGAGDPVLRWAHGGFAIEEAPFSARRGEHPVRTVPPPAGRVLLRETAPLLGVPLVHTLAAWEGWAKSGRGRDRPGLVKGEGLVAPAPHRVLSWLVARKRGRDADLVFHCPLGPPVSTEDEGIFRGLPGTRALAMEIATRAFATEALDERLPAPLVADKGGR